MRNYAPDRYKWPPKYRLNVYWASGRFRAFWNEKDLDLADTLMWSSSRRQVIRGVTSESKAPAWRLWNSRTVRKVKWLIHHVWKGGELGPCLTSIYGADSTQETYVQVGSRSAPIGTPLSGLHSW